MIVRCLFFAGSLLLSLFVAAQDTWSIDKAEDGIEVYTRDEPGSEFKAFRATAHISASREQILAVLRNTDKYTAWFGFTKSSQLLQLENHVQYNYVETSFPWPYSNRDMVYRMSIEELASGSIRVLLEGVPDFIPEKKGIVRMGKSGGSILLEPVGNCTKVTYTFHSEPGNVPVWLANNAISELPFRTLQGLRKMVN